MHTAGQMIDLKADELATLPSSASALEAARLMTNREIGSIVVMDDGLLVGIFTERDLMTKVVGAGAIISEMTVADVMVPDPVSVTEDTPRDEAMDLMIKNHFRHLPVLGEGGSLVGMLSIRDLLRHQVDRLREDVRSLEQYLAADGPGG